MLKFEIVGGSSFSEDFSILQFIKSIDSPRPRDSDEQTPLLAPELDAPLVRTKDEVNKEEIKRLHDLVLDDLDRYRLF